MQLLIGKLRLHLCTFFLCCNNRKRRLFHVYGHAWIKETIRSPTHPCTTFPFFSIPSKSEIGSLTTITVDWLLEFHKIMSSKFQTAQTALFTLVFFFFFLRDHYLLCHFNNIRRFPNLFTPLFYFFL